MSIVRLVAFTLASILVLPTIQPVNAHDGVNHKTESEAQRHQEETANSDGFPDIKGGDFQLINQFGNTRTSANPDGHYQLLFFGYANCKAICSVALPRMAEAVDQLKSTGTQVTPVLITVDPERDTIESLADASAKIHPDLIGLTGSEAALNEAYKSFNIEKKLVQEHPTEGPIYAHGTFIYLLGPDGDFKTLFPPILSSERIAELSLDYINGVKF